MLFPSSERPDITATYIGYSFEKAFLYYSVSEKYIMGALFPSVCLTSLSAEEITLP